MLKISISLLTVALVINILALGSIIETIREKQNACVQSMDEVTKQLGDISLSYELIVDAMYTNHFDVKLLEDIHGKERKIRFEQVKGTKPD